MRLEQAAHVDRRAERERRVAQRRADASHRVCARS
jgi:hypothetical protein